MTISSKFLPMDIVNQKQKVIERAMVQYLNTLPKKLPPRFCSDGTLSILSVQLLSKTVISYLILD